MCVSSLKPKAPDLSAQKAEALRQQQAEQERISADKRKRLEARRSQGSGEALQSLVSFNAGVTSGRSFFAPTGG